MYLYRTLRINIHHSQGLMAGGEARKRNHKCFVAQLLAHHDRFEIPMSAQFRAVIGAKISTIKCFLYSKSI